MVAIWLGNETRIKYFEMLGHSQLRLHSNETHDLCTFNVNVTHTF